MPDHVAKSPETSAQGTVRQKSGGPAEHKIEALDTKKPQPNPSDPSSGPPKKKRQAEPTPEAETLKKPSARRFSDRVYAIRFGKYQAGGEAGDGADKVLVGRSGQRAYFIGLLLRAGRRGAFLVTGNRGVGKTSFVRYCLEEYRNEVLERFLRSNVGRALFWDRIMVVIGAVIGLLVALMLSELMGVLVLSTSLNQGDILRWLVIVPFLIVCLYPLLFAREVLVEVVTAWVRKTRWQKALPEDRLIGEIAGTILLVLAAGGIWRISSFGTPALNISWILVAICAFYLGVQVSSYGLSPEADQGSGRARSWLRYGFTALLPLGVMIFLVWSEKALDGMDNPLKLEGNLFLSLYLLGLGAVFQSVHRFIAYSLGGRKKGFLAACWWYLLAGVSLALPFAIRTSFYKGWMIVTITLAAAVALMVISHASREKVAKIEWVPTPLLGLSIKAALSIVVALQLIHPVMAKLGLAGTNLFYAHREELFWILGLSLCLGVLYTMDYEWVLRPFLRERQDRALNPAVRLGEGTRLKGSEKPEGGPRKQEETREREIHFRLAQLTLPWLLYRSWLPILTVSVNLGFEKLDHRRVVQAMLVGLRAQYHRTFLSWSSGVANLGRGLGLLVLLLLVSLVGQRWFEIHGQDLPQGSFENWQKANPGYAKICDYFQGHQKGTTAVNLICNLKWGDSIFHLLYYDLLAGRTSQNQAVKARPLFTYVVPYRQNAWPVSGANALLREGLHFRIYHILLLVGFFFVGRWILFKLPILPYRDALKRIDETLESLLATTSKTSRVGRWPPTQWLEGVFTDERVRQTQQDPLDPRTVEFLFLQILEEIQSASTALPGARSQLLSLPVPEITFVFDELDKLGTRVEPLAEGRSIDHGQEIEVLNAERRRSFELHRLLADMKNLLSSAPARFIFVGGRNLHDEWLADQTARQPLLTNIFNAEVYLPSLLTDHGRQERSEVGWLSRKVETYVRQQLDRAEKLHKGFVSKLSVPSFGLPMGRPALETFLDPQEEELSQDKPVGSFLNGRILDVDDAAGAPFPGDELARDFIQFLSYRSTGNSKRLKELLNSFIRPVGRVVKKPEVRRADFDCEHVLALDETDRFRIQIIASVFRHLGLQFERAFARRDDKMVTSVFHLSDFIFKFHRRAFSWSNIERVEDMVHIHRAPDLRDVLASIVVNWSEEFLHRIRNGMYDFRFRSELAQEVELISRESPQEMAALNFTLDESQALKTVYESNLKRLGDSSTRELKGMVAGLGELYEFDQEYETARFYYRKAISLLDSELVEVAGDSVLDDETPMIDILGGKLKGQKNARLYLTWGIARLRLMLQVGMTFELSRNLEYAQVEYQNARTLARALLVAMLDEEGRAVMSESDFEKALSGTTGGERLHALKHLNILFQPAFAEAWVAEKLEGGVDTSIALAKKELWELRSMLPFVRETWIPETGGVQHSSFALIFADLHSKLGDLYFFKGRQGVTLGDANDAIAHGRDQLKGESIEVPRPSREGYLLRAHYHYAVGLHMLRRFTSYRIRSSPEKLNIWLDKEGKQVGTISSGGWPDFVSRAAGATFNDFAEVMLGRVSLFALFGNLAELQLKKEANRKMELFLAHFEDACTCWMESARSEKQEMAKCACKIAEERGEKEPKQRRHWIDIPLGSKVLHGGSLEGWLGKWKGIKPSSPDDLLIGYNEIPGHGDLARLGVALNFMLVGAKYLEKGGYVEEAAREFLKVSQAVNRYLWLGVTVQRLLEWREGWEETELLDALEVPWRTSFYSEYWAYLLRVSAYALQRAGQLFLKSRRSSEAGYLIGDKIPVIAVDTACSLGLVAAQWVRNADPAGTGEVAAVRAASTDAQQAVLRLLDKWGSGVRKSTAAETIPDQDQIKAILKEALVRHSYPMVHRLHGLKILIDDELLQRQHADPRNWSKEILEPAEELLDLVARFEAPLHFTPLHLGVTCALVFLGGWKEGQADYPPEVARIRRAAQRYLLKSEEMSTMRWSHYESISNLYYLYDDFNDRQAHFNHAIQMAGLELVFILRYLVNRSDKERQDAFSPSKTGCEKESDAA